MRFGPTILRQCDVLASFSEDAGRLTRRTLTPQHRQAGEAIAGWMREAGMDAGFDALGNVVGRYAGRDPDAPVLMTGSHLDSVVDAGRYDGLFGIVSPIACVRALHDAGRRLPFAIEIVAFGDEEGVRFGVSMLGSRALAGTFDRAVLDRRDPDGITLRDAIAAFGGDADAVAALARDRARVVAFVESHIEQGPVLLAENRAVGVVTSIAGSTRVRAVVTGLAGHAGTVPMGARRDALAAAAEMVLAVERHARERRDTLVATVGKLAVRGGGAINVIAGEVDFSVDLRSGDDARRHAALADVERECRAIAQRRDVSLDWQPFFELAATPCDARLADALASSVAACGHDVRRLPSGAGHDAMEMSRLCPVAMLFVRCGEGGISHHPRETLSAEDAEAGTDVLLHFLEHFDPATLAA